MAQAGCENRKGNGWVAWREHHRRTGEDGSLEQPVIFPVSFHFDFASGKDVNSNHMITGCYNFPSASDQVPVICQSMSAGKIASCNNITLDRILQLHKWSQLPSTQITITGQWGTMTGEISKTIHKDYSFSTTVTSYSGTLHIAYYFFLPCI